MLTQDCVGILRCQVCCVDLEVVLGLEVAELGHIADPLQHPTPLCASLRRSVDSDNHDAWDVMPEVVRLQWQPHIVYGDEPTGALDLQVLGVPRLDPERCVQFAQLRADVLEDLTARHFDIQP